MKIVCDLCGETVIRYGVAKGQAHYYCGKSCAGLARSTPKAVKVERKRLYDVGYREDNLERITAGKREYNERTYTFEKAKVAREAAKERHGADHHSKYCRELMKDPARKAEKVEYDKWRRSRLQYGEFAEAHIALVLLEKAIRTAEPSHYERRKARGYYGNGRQSQERKRDAGISRW